MDQNCSSVVDVVPPCDFVIHLMRFSLQEASPIRLRGADFQSNGLANARCYAAAMARWWQGLANSEPLSAPLSFQKQGASSDFSAES